MTNLRWILIVGATMALPACTATVRQVSIPGGAAGYQIQCSGIQRTWNDCNSEAQKICPTGYYVVSTIKGEPGSAYQYQRVITVRCKA
jgi:hypothetical protein